MITDPIADMLTRMRNALLMRKEQVSVPYSKLKEGIAKILEEEGYITGFETLGEKTKKTMVLQFKYFEDGKSAITTLRRVSKPSRRVYGGYEELSAVVGEEWGIKILSTPKGLFSTHEAKKNKVGGEVLLEVW